MADGASLGPDYLTRSLFLREAEAGPSQQELATMTAPFGGSVEQARALMASPAMQQHLQQYGIHFDPSQVRQSPFLPNAFMGHHPLLGGAFSNAMANAAATPEAPLVSGAGSGISRAMQGMYGGPEMLRQYQVRQMMAPFQVMGMQLPVRAEERRQQLLQSIQEDMAQRRGIEAKQQPELLEIKRMQAEAAAQKAEAAGNAAQAQQIRANAEAEWRQAQAQQAQMPKATPYGLIYPGSGPQITHPEGMPPELGGQISPGGAARFEPYGPQVIQNLVAAHPERTSLAAWRQALMDAGVPQNEADLMAAKAMEAREKGTAAGKKAAGVSPGWTQKAQTQVDTQKNTAKNAIMKEYAPLKETYKSEEEWRKAKPEEYNSMITRLQELEDQYAERIRSIGGQAEKAYTYPGRTSRVAPQTPSYFGPPNPPGASAGSAQAGGAGSQRSEGTATLQNPY